MNEKALSVLEQFGLKVKKSERDRGGLIVDTDNGKWILYECIKGDGYYEKEAGIDECLLKSGFENIDWYKKNIDGGIFANDEKGRKYYLKKWKDARDCDVTDSRDVIRGAVLLAKLHKAFLNISCDNESIKFNNGTDLRMKFDRHTKEMRMVGNFLKNKKNKNEFEIKLRKEIISFHGEAIEAIDTLEKIPYGKRLEKARNEIELCHGAYNYHNIRFGENENYILNFDHTMVDCAITDLYQYMRKILEKNNWDIAVGQNMIEAYNKEKCIDEVDLEILKINFMYPEKFWKIVNYYNGTSKSFIPRKSYEKLEIVCDTNLARQKFLESLH